MKIVESAQPETHAAMESLNVEKSGAIQRFKLSAAGIGV